MFAGRLDGALEAPQLARHLGPWERGRCWALRASACRRKRSIEDAADAWEHALQLSPNDPWVLSRYAIWHLDQGRFVGGLDTAMQGVERASAFPDDQPYAHQVRGQALWMCGYPLEALADFVTAARLGRLNSPTQLCAVVSIAVALAHSPTATKESANPVLEMAAELRRMLGTRPLSRIRALLRWATGLAECARGRTSAGARDLYRARQAFLDLSDVATAAVITIDYATVTGRAVEPLLREILHEAPVDTEEQTLAILAGLASGRCDTRSQRNRLVTLAMTSAVLRRSEL